MAVEDVVEEIGPGLGETELGTAGDWADGVLVSSGTVMGHEHLGELEKATFN